METITNAASAAAGAASKMIWGDNANNGTDNVTAQSGTEPISGVKGSGTATDPYDGGNKEENIAPAKTETTSTKTASTEHHVDSLVPPPKGNEPTHTRTDSAIHANPAEITQPKQTSKDGNTGGFGTVESSVDANPKSAQQPTPKQQGADRPKDEPSTSQEHKAVKEDKHSAEAAAEHEPATSPAPSGTSGATDASPSPGVGGIGNLSPPKDETSEEAKQGTGEKYIKSTGEASQGGDFDAAKAGAGKEADRLLELKGVDRSPDSRSKASPETSPSPAAAENTEKTEKTSLSQKLKDKLHIHKH